MENRIQDLENKVKGLESTIRSLKDEINTIYRILDSKQDIPMVFGNKPFNHVQARLDSEAHLQELITEGKEFFTQLKNMDEKAVTDDKNDRIAVKMLRELNELKKHNNEL